ncbi:MAG: anaerobic sulfatase maturase [Acidimicrobiia bacterium]|nr:anaerobic sulfatase maturase [Acidimicrobiia bacterium]
MQGAPPAFHLLAKPTGPICNLDCEYCFFLSKEMLYPGDRFRMADEMLDEYIRQILEAHRTPDVTIAWQGGEPTMMGLDFFRRSVELAEQHRKPWQRIQYSIQTNGVLLNDRWAEFFKENDFLVGLSVDGPKELHDAYRVDKRGIGSFDRVMAGYEHLKAAAVEVNVLCTIHAANQDHGLEVYRFFRDDMGVQFIQFIPIIERTTETLLPLANLGWSTERKEKRPLYIQQGTRTTDRTVGAEAYGQFLIDVFDEWVKHDVGEVYVQMFDVALANWHGEPPGLCIFSETCGLALALEHNGDLYSCDHYVEPEHLLGNITETPMIELVASDQQRAFGLAKRETLPQFCLDCDVRFACHGGCPRNRFTTTPDGEEGLNYLCPSYKDFFHHIDPAMKMMSRLLRQGRAPAEIMKLGVPRDG